MGRETTKPWLESICLDRAVTAVVYLVPTYRDDGGFVRPFPMNCLGRHLPRLCGAFRRAAFTTLLTICLVSVASAQNPVTIKIKAQGGSTIAPGFSGFNVPQPRNGVVYYDPKFVAVSTLFKAGWVRYPAGTASMAFDWTTGHTDIT